MLILLEALTVSDPPELIVLPRPVPMSTKPLLEVVPVDVSVTLPVVPVVIFVAVPLPIVIPPGAVTPNVVPVMTAEESSSAVDAVDVIETDEAEEIWESFPNRTAPGALIVMGIPAVNSVFTVGVPATVPIVVALESVIFSVVWAFNVLPLFMVMPVTLAPVPVSDSAIEPLFEVSCEALMEIVLESVMPSVVWAVNELPLLMVMPVTPVPVLVSAIVIEPVKPVELSCDPLIVIAPDTVFVAVAESEIPLLAETALPATVMPAASLNVKIPATFELPRSAGAVVRVSVMVVLPASVVPEAVEFICTPVAFTFNV